MKSLKVKLISTISIFVLAVALLIVGVWAVGETQHINLNGSVNFTIADDTLYIKDIRIRDSNDLTGQGTTINNFMPGFVNGEVDLDLGALSADTSFSLFFDIINTSTTAYQASSQSTIPNATLSVSGEITGDGIAPSEINESTSISGTIVMTITAQSAGNISLDNVVINVEEKTYNVTITHNFVATNNNCTLYAKIDDNEEVILEYGDSIELSGSSLSLSFQSFTTYQSTLNCLNSSLQIGDVELYAPDQGYDFGDLYINNNIATDIGIVQSSGAGYWYYSRNDDILLTGDAGVINGHYAYSILTINLTEDCTINIQ